MNLVTVAVKNLSRNKLRSLLTVSSVAVTVIGFIMLRTVIWSWNTSVQQSSKDRIGIRHKVAFVLTLPKRYADDIRNFEGVSGVSYANWFAGKDPKNDKDFFATIAVDPKDLLAVYDEIQVDPRQATEWKENRRGALVGDALAKKRGWRVGDRVTLQSALYPGDWEFVISGIYTSSRLSVDRSTFWFHWDYLNESLRPELRDQVSWIMARVSSPGRSAEICRNIDAKFSERDVQTLSMSESAFQSSRLGMFSAVLRAIDAVSAIILAILLLILANTTAMGVRERTSEYGVLRAIGFVPRQIVAFVVGEALAIGVLGTVIGVGLSYPLVQQGLGRFLEENMGFFFPYFRIQPTIVLAALTLSILLSLSASALPALRASRLKVTDSLRRIA